MSIPRRILIVLLLIAVAPWGSAAHADKITWLTMEFPPFFINQGKSQGQGIADGIMDLLEHKLKGHIFDRQVASPAEIVGKIRGDDDVCSVAYIKTPVRERFMTFSIPDLILPPNGITIRKTDLAKFGGGAPVSLATLLRNPKLKLGIAKGRSYGSKLDDILEHYQSRPYVYARLGDDIYRTLFEMLSKGSVDYIVGYPYEARYIAAELGLEGQVVSLPVVENQQYTLAHVVCPKSPWGQLVIRQINEVLQEERPKEEYRNLIERWIDPGQVEEFRKQYETVFLASHE